MRTIQATIIRRIFKIILRLPPRCRFDSRTTTVDDQRFRNDRKRTDCGVIAALVFRRLLEYP